MRTTFPHSPSGSPVSSGGDRDPAPGPSNTASAQAPSRARGLPGGLMDRAAGPWHQMPSPHHSAYQNARDRDAFGWRDDDQPLPSPQSPFHDAMTYRQETGAAPAYDPSAQSAGPSGYQDVYAELQGRAVFSEPKRARYAPVPPPAPVLYSCAVAAQEAARAAETAAPFDHATWDMLHAAPADAGEAPLQPSTSRAADPAGAPSRPLFADPTGLVNAVLKKKSALARDAALARLDDIGTALSGNRRAIEIFKGLGLLAPDGSVTKILIDILAHPGAVSVLDTLLNDRHRGTLGQLGLLDGAGRANRLLAAICRHKSAHLILEKMRDPGHLDRLHAIGLLDENRQFTDNLLALVTSLAAGPVLDRLLDPDLHEGLKAVGLLDQDDKITGTLMVIGQCDAAAPLLDKILDPDLNAPLRAVGLLDVNNKITGTLLAIAPSGAVNLVLDKLLDPERREGLKQVGLVDQDDRVTDPLLAIGKSDSANGVLTRLLDPRQRDGLQRLGLLDDAGQVTERLVTVGKTSSGNQVLGLLLDPDQRGALQTAGLLDETGRVTALLITYSRYPSVMKKINERLGRH